jgi:hypothetical protein
MTNPSDKDEDGYPVGDRHRGAVGRSEPPYSEREFGASQSDYEPKEQQMSDIVERLRLQGQAGLCPVCLEAADYIERLRAGRAADPEAVELAQRIVEYANAEDRKAFSPHPWKYNNYEITLARALLASASSRAAVVEECAKVADQHADFCHKEAHSGGDFQHLVARRTEATYLAQRIRALKGGAA